MEPVMVASRAVTAAVVRSLEEVAPPMPLPQLRALVTVGTHQPISIGAIAEGLGVNPSNASRACDRLVHRGLLHRVPDAEDGRRVSLSLTKAGAALLDQVLSRRRAELESVVRAMAPAERTTLMEGLRAFNEAAVRTELLISIDATEPHLVDLLR